MCTCMRLRMTAMTAQAIAEREKVGMVAPRTRALAAIR